MLSMVSNDLRRRLRSVVERPAVTRPSRIGTFHKTGTVLWSTILRDLQRDVRLRVWWSSRARSPLLGWDIEFNDHASFRHADPSAPTLICVRDPRDVVLSAARYHVRADEPWLTMPTHRYPGDYWPTLGATYREAINALPTIEERVVFEMDHSGGRTVRAMVAAKERHPDAMIVRLEDLMVDADLSLFRSCFRLLGLRDELMPAAAEAARRNSIFGGVAEKRAHVQSGRAGVWREAFDDRLTAAFAERFGDAADRLGYPA
ncbi:hypothetical protein [Rubrimonas sp.]|uniref:hypothetical protein n=1 Tax=Rubrimonas sp. TaxID=2036015 RepID=UPI002FDD2010